jgi:hypothetical protein
MKSLFYKTFSPWKTPDNHFLPKKTVPVIATPNSKNGEERKKESINKLKKPFKIYKDI